MKMLRVLFWSVSLLLFAAAGAGAYLASPLGKDADARLRAWLGTGEPQAWMASLVGKEPRRRAAADKPAGEAKKEKVKRVKPAVPVVAAPAKLQDLEIQLDALGTVTPLHAVTVRTRIDSQLVRVYFREGQMVRKGQLLAEVDARPFQVQLAQARAQMARDRALLRNARLDLERYRVLFEQESLPRQQLDTQEALVQQYESTVAADQAAIDSARLQLAYCDIVAPIAGRAGLRQVDPGNWVRTSDPNGIVTVTQLAPISAVFSVPEDRVPALMKRLREGARLGVAAYDRAGSERLATGTLLTVDNQIDPATGTVKLKAVFANEDERLFPNQFVNVRMVLEVQRGATVIDEAAVQRGAKGTFVYAVNGDQTVTLRPVSLGAGQNGRVAVLQGLKAHELVVVDGADRLSDGTTVELVGADGPTLAGEEPPREKRKKKRDAGTPAGAPGPDA